MLQKFLRFKNLSFFQYTLILNFLFYSVLMPIFFFVIVTYYLLIPLEKKIIHNAIEAAYGQLETFEQTHAIREMVEFPYRLSQFEAHSKFKNRGGHRRSELNTEIFINTQLEPQNSQNSFVNQLYLYLLKQELYEVYRVDIEVQVRIDEQCGVCFWFKTPNNDTYQEWYVGLPKTLIAENTYGVILLVLLASVLINFLLTLFIARKLSSPIKELHTSITLLRKQGIFKPAKEEGLIEFSQFNKQLNKTVSQLQTILSNRTTLLSAIAHDLRTPITQIQLTLEMLDTVDKELIASIEEDIQRMEKIIASSLQLGSNMAKREKIMPIHLNQELKSIINRMGKNKTLAHFEPFNGVDFCSTVRPTAFFRIIDNFLSNAVRYGEGKPIKITLRHNHKEGFIIQVKDSGIGIEADQIEKVFQPFYRIEGSRNRDTGGSGVGLSIVRQLSELYGWTSKLEPGDGGGVVATLIIPPDINDCA